MKVILKFCDRVPLWQTSKVLKTSEVSVRVDENKKRFVGETNLFEEVYKGDYFTKTETAKAL